jgi:Flp pilus assembly pilin Flp
LLFCTTLGLCDINERGVATIQFALVVALISLVVLVVGTRVAPSLIGTMQTVSAGFAG